MNLFPLTRATSTWIASRVSSASSWTKRPDRNSHHRPDDAPGPRSGDGVLVPDAEERAAGRTVEVWPGTRPIGRRTSRSARILLVVLLSAAALIAAAGIIVFAHGQQTTKVSPLADASRAPSRADAAALAALLRQGTPDTAAAYWLKPSAALEAAAAGAEDARFRALGALLVKDGYARAIIDLGREMTGAWYDWSEQRCPPAEPGCYALAWRHAVDAMRSAPGQHFRFLWTVFPNTAAAIDAWPGAAYVDLVGTDIYDWYGGPDNTYPHTASGQLDHDARWQEILTQPGGLDWLARLSQLTGKPIAIPEWGMDFHTFGGQDDPAFITRMLAWLHAHHAIGVYWAVGHVDPSSGCPAWPAAGRPGRVRGQPGRGKRPRPAARRPPAVRRGIPARPKASLRFVCAAGAGALAANRLPAHPQRPAGAADRAQLCCPAPAGAAAVPAGRLPGCARRVSPGDFRRPAPARSIGPDSRSWDLASYSCGGGEPSLQRSPA